MEESQAGSAVELGRHGSQHPSPSESDDSVWAQFASAQSLDAFYTSWLALQCRQIGGTVAGMLLVGNADGSRFTPAAIWPTPRQNVRYLSTAAEHALANRRGYLQRRERDSDSHTSAGDGYDVAYPVEVEGKPCAVVALDLTFRPEAQLQAAMRQLHWGCGWLEVLFRREQHAQEVTIKERLRVVLELAATVFSHERFHAAAMAFVTDLATRLHCDRVSIGFVRHGRTHVRAVSHSAHFKKKTNLVRAIAAAMDEAADQQAVVVYPSSESDSDHIVRAHAALAQGEDAGAVCSVPFPSAGPALGVITLELPVGKTFTQEQIELATAAAGLAGPILDTLRREDRWLVTKAVDSCSVGMSHVLGVGHMTWKLVSLLVIGLVVFLIVAKGDYRVSAKTVLEPAVKQAAAAPLNGYVREAPARAGDIVQAGQLLCLLDDRDLRLERLKALSQREEYKKQYHQAVAERKASQAEIFTAQVHQAEAQIALLDDQLSRVRIVAPFDGLVVSGDLSQSLGAPVEKGQTLFEVAPLHAYRVILEVDERDVTDVLPNQQGSLLLSAVPTELLPLIVDKLTPVATAKEGRNYFRIEAHLEREPPRLRPGMEGVSKVEIDQRRLIWIWTHDVINAIRLWLWTWWP